MTAPPLLVVAAALIAPDERVLVARCSADKAHGGLWEFPGGKVEPGEPIAAALAREIDEELGITIVPAAEPVGFALDRLADRDLILLLFAVRIWRGTPRAKEHEALAWHSAPDLDALPMPTADRALLPALRRDLATGATR